MVKNLELLEPCQSCGYHVPTARFVESCPAKNPQDFFLDCAVGGMALAIGVRVARYDGADVILSFEDQKKAEAFLRVLYGIKGTFGDLAIAMPGEEEEDG